ncbi:hypothetical protein ACFYZ9_33375 [Streptomyces sp. NPDC001691]|uniref:hypothetical protein n=1 Tax=Streptomyces sp. NPDC001691 TaxID=3364600 RepID=UPI0036C750A3
MPTARTRKTDPDVEDKATDAVETPDPSVEDKAVGEAPETKSPADGPKQPDVAPLEPPAQREPEPDAEPIRNPQQIIPEGLDGSIVDDATGKPPAEIDTVFEAVTPYGNALRCTVRLVEHVGLGTYRTPTTRLLVPAGAELDPVNAQRIVTRLRAQAANQ